MSLMARDDVFREKLFVAIGRKVAEVRKRGGLGLSQSKLASQVGITRSAVSAIEAGHQGVSIQTLCQLAAALEVAPGELLPDHEELRALMEQSEPSPAEALVEEFLESYG